MTDCCDENVRKHEPVVGVVARFLISDVDFVECAVEPFATAVARKHTASSVRTVGSRSEPDDQTCSVRIAKIWHRFRPVSPVAVAGALFKSDLLAP